MRIFVDQKQDKHVFISDGVKIDAPQQQSVIAGSDALIRCAAKEEGTEKIGRIVWRGKDYQEIPNGGCSPLLHYSF